MSIGRLYQHHLQLDFSTMIANWVLLNP